MPRIDYVIILIGTNDCKSTFDSLQSDVPDNLDKLLSVVSNYDFASNSHPAIIVVTPPPIGDDAQTEEKYAGARRRLQNLLPHFGRRASRHRCRYLDIHSPLEPGFASLSADGIHLTSDGYARIAHQIDEKIDEQHPFFSFAGVLITVFLSSFERMTIFDDVNLHPRPAVSQ